MELFAHPFAAYCQKVLSALYENSTPFTYRMLGGDSATEEEWKTLWPLRKMPVLIDAGRVLIESSVIIEYLDLHHPGQRPLLPADSAAALEVRFMDRFFDNYIATPMQKIVSDFRRPVDQHDPVGVADARATLNSAYQWLNGVMTNRVWGAGADFSMADCAAAPALLYADWVLPIDASLGHAIAYRQRLLARPSFARAVNEARPYRHFFPPGDPKRD